MPGTPDSEILNLEQAALLLGVSVKTFNKVLHSQDLPARKIGREWKFSRSALIAWVGQGSSRSYYQGGLGDDDHDLVEPHPPQENHQAPARAAEGAPSRSPEPMRRTTGWRLEERLD
jgi:excisionase family DNA binding protein